MKTGFRLFAAALGFFLLPHPLPAASYLVTNTNNAGPGSLRQAIENANANPSPNNYIQFNLLPLGPGVKTIHLLSPLDSLTGPVLLDAYPLTGATANTLTNGENAVLKVELDGSLAGPEADGLTLEANFCLITATATDPDGNTSEFSKPAW